MSNRHRQRILLLVLPALLCAFLAIPSAAQTAEEVVLFSGRAPAVGPVGLGSAGAGVAGIADFSAFFVNPAGLGYFEESVAGGSFDVTAVSNEGVHPGGGFPAFTVDEATTAYGVGSAAYLHKIPTVRGSLVVGAAFNQNQTFERTLRFLGENGEHSITHSFLPFSDEYEVDGDGNLVDVWGLPGLAYDAGAIEFYGEYLDEDPDAYPWEPAAAFGRPTEQSGTVIEEGRSSEISLGGAWAAAPEVMAGLSLNVVVVDYFYSNQYQETDIGEGFDGYIVLLQDDQLEGFDQFSLEDRLEVQMRGVNLRGGISANVLPILKIGAVLESPTWIWVEEDYEEFMQTFFEVGGSLSAADGPFSYEYQIRTPWRFSGGASLEFGALSVRGDVEFIDWSHLRIIAPPDATSDERTHFDSVNETLRLDYRQVFNTRLGADLGLGALTLRSGLAYQPDPFIVQEGEFSRDRLFLSAGLSYRMEQFQIDAGLMQERFENEFIAYQDADFGSLVIDEDTQRTRFQLGVKFFF